MGGVSVGGWSLRGKRLKSNTDSFWLKSSISVSSRCLSVVLLIFFIFHLALFLQSVQQLLLCSTVQWWSIKPYSESMRFVLQHSDASEYFPFVSAAFALHWMTSLIQIQPKLHEIISAEQTDASSPALGSKMGWSFRWIQHRQQRVSH